mgnify:CR=1 FL=1
MPYVIGRWLGGTLTNWETISNSIRRLKEMEELGLVKRKVLSTRPIAVTYEITDFGRSSLSILEQLKDWAEDNGL